MNILIMANIGNSDLLIDGKRPSRPRPDGEAVWPRLSEHQIELPILEPCLRFIQKQHPDASAHLICFYTDQPETSLTTQRDRFGVSLRDKDTIWFAQIATQVLPTRLSGWLQTAQAVPIEGAVGRDLNPSIYDEVFEAYRYLMTRHVDRAVDRCYILTAGGIPACNFALQFHAIIAYAERCRFVYPPEGGRVSELRIGEQMLVAFQRASVIAALDQYDFPSALASARRAHISDPATGLLEYAVYREAFDFRRAQQAIERAERSASGSLREQCARLSDDLRQVSEQNNPGALLREVVYSAEIAFRNGRYADMLGRIFRFQEGVLRWIVEHYLDLPTDMSRAKRETNLTRYRDQIDANPSLRDYLEQKTIDGQPLRYCDGPNRLVMQTMVEFLISGGARADGRPWAGKNERNRLQVVSQIMQRLDKLAELRNQSVIAHGFAGVSREEIDELYQNADRIIRDLHDILDKLDLAEAKSPFDLVVTTVKEALGIKAFEKRS